MIPLVKVKGDAVCMVVDVEIAAAVHAILGQCIGGGVTSPLWLQLEKTKKVTALSHKLCVKNIRSEEDRAKGELCLQVGNR